MPGEVHGPPDEMDHFWGRRNAPQSEFNCWMLCRACHRAKTDNRPSAAYWLERFFEHTDRHRSGAGYVREAKRASERLAIVTARNSLSASPRSP